jgi:hypothetical protein
MNNSFHIHPVPLIHLLSRGVFEAELSLGGLSTSIDMSRSISLGPALKLEKVEQLLELIAGLAL